jgi:hypothetical protein
LRNLGRRTRFFVVSHGIRTPSRNYRDEVFRLNVAIRSLSRSEGHFARNRFYPLSVFLLHPTSIGVRTANTRLRGGTAYRGKEKAQVLSDTDAVCVFGTQACFEDFERAAEEWLSLREAVGGLDGNDFREA